jgi:hypothetical protein
MRLIHLGFLVSMMCSQVLGVAIEGLVGDEPVVESFSSIKQIPTTPPVSSVEGDVINIIGFEISAITQSKIEEMQINTIDPGMQALVYMPYEIKWVFTIMMYSDSVENARLVYDLFWNRVNLLIHWYSEILESIHFDDDCYAKARKASACLKSIRAKYKPLGVEIFDKVGNNYRNTEAYLALEKEISDLLFERYKQEEQSTPTLDVKMPKFACKL